MAILDALTFESEGFKPLLSAVLQRRFLHAYLFHSPCASTAYHFAVTFARALNCLGDKVPCEVCDHCLQSLAGSFPAIETIRPMGINIRIEQIRQTIKKSRYRFGRAMTQCFIVCPAEAMNEQAANAFLKVLEEPTERTVFLLVTARPDTLLATIRSRCNPTRLAFPTSSAILDRLPSEEPWDTDLAYLALALSDGAPTTVRWAEELAKGCTEAPALVAAGPGAYGLSFLDGHEGLDERLMGPDPLRSDPEVSLPLFYTTTAMLGKVVRSSDVTAAFEAAGIVAAAGPVRLESELPPLLRKIRTILKKNFGDGYRHPLLGEPKDVDAVTRQITFKWTDLFFRCILTALQTATKIASGPETPLNISLSRRFVELTTLARFPIPAVGRIAHAVERARQHLYANVKPIRLILENLITTVSQTSLVSWPGSGGPVGTAWRRSGSAGA